LFRNVGIKRSYVALRPAKLWRKSETANSGGEWQESVRERATMGKTQ
jgi:hypothetical protein